MQMLEELAKEIGFAYVHEVNMEALVPREDVRAMCSADLCKNYGKSWSCPPSPICSDLERVKRQMNSYERGFLVQTTVAMEDEFDMEAIGHGNRLHKKCFDTLVRQLRLKGVDFMPLAAGACMRCYKCTYPDRPCRYPEKLYASMEAYGLWVSDVCEKSGLAYRHGDKTITYTACILYQRKQAD